MSTISDVAYTLHLPAREPGLEQDEEYCEIEMAGERRRIRFHDYDEIFGVPGLYERLFAEALDCDSPKVVADLLDSALRAEGEDPADLRVLDFGAGNGLVGAELARIGCGSIIGVDLLEEAKMAAARDRPGVYDDYHALDLTALDAEERAELEATAPTCMTCVAALGFGDVPVAAFATAFDLVADGGWIAFNIREDFVGEADTSGFARTLSHALSCGTIEELARLQYVHRMSVAGDPLSYVAVVGRKRGPLAIQ